MLTLYTAIGTLKFKKCPNGKSLPTVINSGQEYGLSDHELILWSCLAFQVLQIHELENAYTFRLENSDKKQALPFSHYLNRLLLRGLIVKGEGLTGVDALYRLFGELHIMPVVNTFPIRLFTYIQLRLEGKANGADIGKYLRKAKYTPMEKTILRLAQEVPITTAELVTCVELGKENQPSGQMLDELYQNPKNSFQTLAEDAQIHHIQYPVLQAIGNLYLNKQISFQRL